MSKFVTAEAARWDAEGHAEAEVRDFATQFPTPNVAQAIALCESGRLTWEQVRDLFARSLRTALEATE